MSYVDALVKYGQVVGVNPGSTSYFSTPSDELDPRLFQGEQLRPWVRNGITRILFEYLAVRYVEPRKWVSAWIAGSAVSYQWEAARDPGDLDCLVGINYPEFRRHNSEYAGLSDEEIASMFNEDFSSDIMPETRNWEGYELTYYVNPQSDIRDINPYAAYDLINDSWTVAPDRHTTVPFSRNWEQQIQRDYETAATLVQRYGQALTDIRSSGNPAYRINAERRLKEAIEQAVTFYEDIHAGRKIAFSRTGNGYADFNNYRWQAGKRSGAIHALRKIKEYHDAAERDNEVETYGVELPSTRTLVRRAATRGVR